MTDEEREHREACAIWAAAQDDEPYVPYRHQDPAPPRRLRIPLTIGVLLVLGWVLALVLGLGSQGKSDYCDDAVATGSYGAAEQGKQAALAVCNDTSYLER